MAVEAVGCVLQEGSGFLALFPRQVDPKDHGLAATPECWPRVGLYATEPEAQVGSSGCSSSFACRPWRLQTPPQSNENICEWGQWASRGARKPANQATPTPPHLVNGPLRAFHHCPPS